MRVSLHVAVDFGTSSTCVALSLHGREPQVVGFDGQPLVPSAVFAAADGTLFVGHEAERQAAVDPSRYEPHPKRRVDEGELLLGTSILSVSDVVRAVLVRAVNEARRVAGGAPVDLLVLTHPADWGAVRTRVLTQAARGLANEVRLVPEPVAAAVFHSASHALADGVALAVLDLGGGTVDASVVSRHGNTFRVLATKGDPSFGGADIDQLLLEHVGSLVAGGDREAWRQLVEGREMVDRRRRRVLRQDVRGAKETLSRHSYTDVPMPQPFPDAHVTRVDLERLISTSLNRAVALVLDAVRDAGLDPRRLAGVFLVGGSSRIPMVARLVLEQSGVMPTSIEAPETVVARGALRAVSVDPDRTSALPGQGEMTQEFSRPDDTTHTDATHKDATRKITRKITPPDDYRAFSPATPAAGFGQQSRFPPPLPAVPKRHSRTPLIIGVVVLLVAVVGGSVALAINSGNDSNSSGANATASTATAQSPAKGKQIAAYDYSFAAPEGWQQSGGQAQTRKVQLRPEPVESDQDIIAVQEQKLSYDATADRDRAVTELRALYDEGADLSDFDPSATFADKDVVYYREYAGTATIDWYVLFQGDVQVSVGCQYGQAAEVKVRAACEQVVRTLTITG